MKRFNSTFWISFLLIARIGFAMEDNAPKPNADIAKLNFHSLYELYESLEITGIYKEDLIQKQLKIDQDIQRLQETKKKGYEVFKGIIESGDSLKEFKKAFTPGVSPFFHPNDQPNLLALSAQNGRKKIVKFLLKNVKNVPGFDKNFKIDKQSCGNTALAIICEAEKPNIAMIELLLKKGANPKPAQNTAKNKRVRKILERAISSSTNTVEEKISPVVDSFTNSEIYKLMSANVVNEETLLTAFDEVWDFPFDEFKESVSGFLRWRTSVNTFISFLKFFGSDRQKKFRNCYADKLKFLLESAPERIHEPLIYTELINMYPIHAAISECNWVLINYLKKKSVDMNVKLEMYEFGPNQTRQPSPTDQHNKTAQMLLDEMISRTKHGNGIDSNANTLKIKKVFKNAIIPGRDRSFSQIGTGFVYGAWAELVRNQQFVLFFDECTYFADLIQRGNADEISYLNAESEFLAAMDQAWEMENEWAFEQAFRMAEAVLKLKPAYALGNKPKKNMANVDKMSKLEKLYPKLRFFLTTLL